jgi:hypothetical protein
MLHLVVAIQVAVISRSKVLTLPRRARGDEGQATAEYALVLLGAAAVALVFAAWAMKSGKVAALLDAVMDKILSKL